MTRPWPGICRRCVICPPPSESSVNRSGCINFISLLVIATVMAPLVRVRVRSRGLRLRLQLRRPRLRRELRLRGSRLQPQESLQPQARAGRQVRRCSDHSLRQLTWPSALGRAVRTPWHSRTPCAEIVASGAVRRQIVRTVSGIAHYAPSRRGGPEGRAGTPRDRSGFRKPGLRRRRWDR